MAPVATLSAKEAAETLGISLATLYAYVSRGLIRSEGDGRSRSRRYDKEDVLAIKARKEHRKEPEKVAETALHWGMPVMDSALTLIREGRLYYRGRDATALAEDWPVERVAALLWTGDPDAPCFESAPAPLSRRWLTTHEVVRDLAFVERFQVLVPVAGAEDLAAFDLRPSAVVQVGARLLRQLVAIACGGALPNGSIAEALAGTWAPDMPGAADALNAALILTADHELNVSAFAARCAASAGSTPYAVVSAGLAALQGPKHGGHCERVEALFAETGEPGLARATLAARLRRGEEIPGFGHTLYPAGDPRGAALLALATRLAPEAPGLRLAQALVEAADELLGESPTVDVGLVTLARSLDLPRGTPIALFALGRAIGWIAHAMEQYESDRLIRPRARYVGVPPEDSLPAD